MRTHSIYLAAALVLAVAILHSVMVPSLAPPQPLTVSQSPSPLGPPHMEALTMRWKFMGLTRAAANRTATTGRNVKDSATNRTAVRISLVRMRSGQLRQRVFSSAHISARSVRSWFQSCNDQLQQWRASARSVDVSASSIISSFFRFVASFSTHNSLIAAIICLIAIVTGLVLGLGIGIKIGLGMQSAAGTADSPEQQPRDSIEDVERWCQREAERPRRRGRSASYAGNESIGEEALRNSEESPPNAAAQGAVDPPASVSASDADLEGERRSSAASSAADVAAAAAAADPSAPAAGAAPAAAAAAASGAALPRSGKTEEWRPSLPPTTGGGLTGLLGEAMQDFVTALPPELRELVMPLDLELSAILNSKALLPLWCGFLEKAGFALSHLSAVVLLRPRSRRLLRRGLRALRHTVPLPLPGLLQALVEVADGRWGDLFLWGLRGSMVLDPSMQVEEDVGLSRLFEVESAAHLQPQQLRAGLRVRVLMEDTERRPAPTAGLFQATVESFHREPLSGRLRAKVRYVDDVALVAGAETEGAEYNVMDRIPELRSRWRLWLQGLAIDLTMPKGKAAGKLVDTIRVKWREPGVSKAKASASASDLFSGGAGGGSGSTCSSGGTLGTIDLEVNFAPHVRASIRQGRFWSDNALLHIGSFRGAELECEEGSVEASVSIALEQDGAYLTVERLRLGLQNIFVRAARGHHGNRIGLLLKTWSLQRWLFSGWLERLLLRLIEQVVVEEQQHKLILRWDELAFISDWRELIATWQLAEAQRELSERRTAATHIQRWARGRQARRSAPPPIIVSRARTLADAVAELFPPARMTPSLKHSRSGLESTHLPPPLPPPLLP